MDINPNFLISLYTRLRDPTGQSVNEVTLKLEEFSQVPQSIFCFFQVITTVPDPVIRSYAVLGVRDYLINHKNVITAEYIEMIRRCTIQCLSNEPDVTTRLQIINTISVLIRYFPGEWPDLNQFMFSSDFTNHLSSILQIITHLFSMLSDNEIQEHNSHFMNIILAGFQSPDFTNNCAALSFFYQILIKVNDTSQFEIFQKPLYELLKKIIATENTQMLTQFLEPISIGINNNIIFFPFDLVLPLILPVLHSNVEIEFKFPLNSLLGLYLQYANEQISIETLTSIFELETQLIIQFYDFCNTDPHLIWLSDCVSLFDGIYMRIPEETVVHMAMSKFQQLAQQQQARFKLSAIAIIDSAINSIPENFSELILSLYPQLLNFLSDNDQFVQNFASDTLSGIAEFFQDFITNNLIIIVQRVLQFIQTTGDSIGTHLLSSIMQATFSSDELFPSLLPTILDFLRSPEPMIEQDGAKILQWMILKAQAQSIYIFGEQIATTVIELLKESLVANYTAYSVLEALCRKIPDLMVNCINEILPLIIAGIHSNDAVVQSEALKLVSVLPNVVHPDSDFMKMLFSELLSIANTPYDPNGSTNEQQLAVSGSAIFQASVLANYLFDNTTNLPLVLSAVVYVAQMPSMNCLSFASKGFQFLANPISRSQADIDAVTNPTEQMVALLIDKLADSSRYDFSLLRDIISAIAIIIKTCGVEILKHKEIGLIQILSSVLTQTMNPYTGALICPDDLLGPISDLFIGIAFSTEGNTKEILDKMLPMLTELLNHKSYQYQCFSISTFAELISRNSTMSLMPEDMRIGLIQLMLDRIQNARPYVASAAATLIFRICKNEESVPLLNSYVSQTLTSLIQRLESVTQLTTENILMRENILLAISSIGSYVLENQFPIKETMPIILKALPIVKQFLVTNDEVYKFLNSVSHLVSPELQIEYIRIYSWVIARPEPQIDIKVFILVNIGTVLAKFLDVYPPEQQQEIIANFLNNDQYKMKYFAISFEKIREMSRQISIT